MDPLCSLRIRSIKDRVPSSAFLAASSALLAVSLAASSALPAASLAASNWVCSQLKKTVTKVPKTEVAKVNRAKPSEL